MQHLNRDFSKLLSIRLFIKIDAAGPVPIII